MLITCLRIKISKESLSNILLIQQKYNILKKKECKMKLLFLINLQSSSPNFYIYYIIVHYQNNKITF